MAPKKAVNPDCMIKLVRPAKSGSPIGLGKVAMGTVGPWRKETGPAEPTAKQKPSGAIESYFNQKQGRHVRTGDPGSGEGTRVSEAHRMPESESESGINPLLEGSASGKAIPIQEPSDSVSLEAIYQTIMARWEETRTVSHKTQSAYCKLQGAIRRVAKICSEFSERMGELKTRTVTLESESLAHNAVTDQLEIRMSDTQWKLEVFENRLRLNNLRVLGSPEEVEDNDIREFIIKLFKGAFPELLEWNWATEVHHAHRFPFEPRRQGRQESDKLREVLFLEVGGGGFILWLSVYDLASPDRKRSCEGCNIFVRPDFCHVNVEERQHLRQLILPFQLKGVQAYLINPATLKIVVQDWAQFFTSEIKAKEFLDGMGPS
ncbi:hypothetical protein NDU88_007233 [Pleurodeles waltl]|uniref:Uncharacterized protein n=1 Tax=Pleurodeles waltl TaxID=8319 RepID=A0AAV7N1I9_PLEWA|nr:hypothetical protein NDU88_007233 [Pleurodeles waltl]